MTIELTEKQKRLADSYAMSTYRPALHGRTDADIFNLKKGIYGEVLFEKFLRSSGITPIGERNFALVPDETDFYTRQGATVNVKTSANSYLKVAQKTVERYPMQQYFVMVKVRPGKRKTVRGDVKGFVSRADLLRSANLIDGVYYLNETGLKPIDEILPNLFRRKGTPHARSRVKNEFRRSKRF